MSVTMLAVYALGVAAVLAPGAWFMERALAGLRLPTRGAWIGALGLCIGLPLAASLSGARQHDCDVPAGTPAVTIAPAEIEGSAVGGSGSKRHPALGSLADWMAELDRALASAAAFIPGGDRVDTWIASVWGAMSILMATVLLASMLRLHRRANHWSEETLFGRPVKVSTATGPATIGPIRPLIVIPRWAKELPPNELELVVRHEGEHVRARDTLLLAMGLFALVACPWNPLVWWQLRRLKEAVEVDCDRRVLRSGVASARYGELLVKVGSRRHQGSLAIPAIAGSIPLLERRLTVMKAVGERVSFPRTAAAMAAALLLIVVACTTEPPVATEAQATEAHAASEARGEEVVPIRVDRDGRAWVNDRLVPIDLMDDVMAPLAPDAVVSLDVHEAARYGVVAALQDQLRAAGLIRVVFTLVGSEDPRPSSDDVDDGVPVVLPATSMPDLRRVNVSRRNLLFLDVLPAGRVEARRGDERGVREIAPSDVEALWRRNVALNPNLIAVARTHPDAEYRYMYDVLDALHGADATRISLQVAP
ncbi:MAG: M56 family metallopeptidase [Longimicrobiales bacterium]